MLGKKTGRDVTPQPDDDSVFQSEFDTGVSEKENSDRYNEVPLGSETNVSGAGSLTGTATPA